MALKIETTARQTVNFDGSKVEEQETVLTAKCDGPNCHKDGAACQGTITWKEAKNEKELEQIPDQVYRLIIVSNFLGTKHLFFSRDCLKEFMRTYVPPKTPREIQTEVAAAAEVLKRHQAKQEEAEGISQNEKSIGGVPEEGSIPTAESAGQAV